MQIAERLNRLIPNLLLTIARFPVCCLVALVSFSIVNLDIAKLIDLITGNEGRVYLSLTAAFLASGAGHLYAESRSWSLVSGSALSAVLAAVFGFAYYFHEATSADPLFLVSGALLLVMTAGYLRHDATERALWLFNARFGLAAVLAFIVALVFCLGISAILASLDYLFDINVHGRMFEHTWASGATVVGPVYGLSLMPRDLNEELTFSDPPALVERGISALINYILAPMILIYLVILYLYAGKIALEWSLPKGQIGMMVLVFGLGGTATYLISRPWADRGTPVLRWFLASWFWLTIVPIGLLAVAVYRRLSDYGVTPERYGLVLVGLWLMAMVVYFALRRRQVASQMIMLSLAVLLLAGAIGPWGAKGLSVTSQLGRLETLMTDHGYLTDGKLAETIPDPSTVPAAVAADGASIIDFLRRVDALDRLEPMFAGRSDNPFEGEANTWAVFGKVNEQLGFVVSGTTRDGGRNLYFNGHMATRTDLSGDHVLFGPVRINQYTWKQKSWEAARQPLRAYLKDGQFVMEHRGSTWTYDAVELMLQVEIHSRSAGIRQRAFKLEIPGTDGKATVLISTANGKIGGKREQLGSMTFWAVLPR